MQTYWDQFISIQLQEDDSLKTRHLFIVPLVIVTATIVLAAGDPVQHQFKAGDAISSNQVNQNFQELADRADVNNQAIQTINNSLDTQLYDFNDYVTPSTISKKIFLVSSNSTNLGYDTETHELSRSIAGEITTISNTIVKLNGGETGERTSTEKVILMQSVDSFLLDEVQHFSSDGSTLIESTLFEPGVPIFLGNMRKGITWGEISKDTRGTNVDYFSYTSVLLGVVSMDVLTDTGVSCLKVLAEGLEGSGYNFKEYSWYCQGYGVVKVITFSNGERINTELVSFN